MNQFMNQSNSIGRYLKQHLTYSKQKNFSLGTNSMTTNLNPDLHCV